MFIGIYKLISKYSGRKPLEDYITEILVGILNQDEQLKNSFLKSCLHLPDDDYTISTQAYYKLENNKDCIVDIHIIGKNTICFIESKVNSKEGQDQLKRYTKVLDLYHNDKIKYLIYCTKFSDIKNYDERYNFRNIRWYEISDFLKRFQKHNVVRDFILFLDEHDMTQNNTLLPEDYSVMNKMHDVISKSIAHLERVSDDFIKTLGIQSDQYVNRNLTIKDILKHDRIVFICNNVMNDLGCSDIKYGFQLKQPNIYVSLWVDKRNSNYYEDFYRIAKSLDDPFVTDEAKDGIAIELRKDISLLHLNENADTIISEWFTESFVILEKLIRSFPKIGLKICGNHISDSSSNSLSSSTEG